MATARSGAQCMRAAMQGGQFCTYHQRGYDEESPHKELSDGIDLTTVEGLAEVTSKSIIAAYAGRKYSVVSSLVKTQLLSLGLQGEAPDKDELASMGVEELEGLLQKMEQGRECQN